MQSSVSVLFVLLLASCGQSPPSNLANRTEQPLGGRFSDSGTMPHSEQRAAQISPVKGDENLLIRYGKQSRERSGVIQYEALINQEAVLASVASRGLAVPLPDGRLLYVTQEQFNIDGYNDWSWLGRTEDGSRVLFTGGANALFGEIAFDHGTKALSLTTELGRGSVQLIDHSKSPKGFGHMGTALDTVIPRQRDFDSSARKASAAKARSESDEDDLPGTADRTIDVLVIASWGFSGQFSSQTYITRIRHLINTTNRALQDSNVPGKLRLVYTAANWISDLSTNNEALEQLVSSPHVLDLKARYGADVVILVRAFRSIDQGGTCGLAIQNGYARQPTRSEYAFGVVSDGSDGNNQVGSCGIYTFAHEFGHAIGLQHDRETATINGVLEYGATFGSFGYRNSVGTYKWHTVMAYNAGGMVPLGKFSNPQGSCYNMPCGTIGSDNAGAMRYDGELMSRAAMFNPRRGRSSSDFNGDSVSDVLWHNTSTGAGTVWLDASCKARPIATVRDTRWKPTLLGDFDDDGVADIFWRHSSSGANAIWPGGYHDYSIALPPVPGRAWQPLGAHDYTGDGKSDILWRNVVTGSNVLWESGDAGRSFTLSGLSVVGWRYAGSGYFDESLGRAGIVWRNSVTGQNLVWSDPLGRADGLPPSPLPTLSSQSWHIAGIADFDADGIDELMWRNMSTGANSIWSSAYAVSPVIPVQATPPTWRVAAVADYRGGGRADIFWRNTRTGANAVWNLDDMLPYSGCLPASVPSQSWQIVR